MTDVKCKLQVKTCYTITAKQDFCGEQVHARLSIYTISSKIAEHCFFLFQLLQTKVYQFVTIYNISSNSPLTQNLTTLDVKQEALAFPKTISGLLGQVSLFSMQLLYGFLPFARNSPQDQPVTKCNISFVPT